MKRILLALPLLMLAAAAPDGGAISMAPVQLAMASIRLPEPPASDSVTLQPAPVPDAQNLVPITVSDGDGSPQLAPKLYTRHEQFGGDGFSDGSSVQNAQQRERPALGFGIAVPVD